MADKKINIEILRIKSIQEGYSVLVTDGETQRGFSFRYNENKHQEVNGIPKYIAFIRQNYRQMYAERKAQPKIEDIQKNDKKVFKEK